jgi:hypothetical protein
MLMVMLMWWRRRRRSGRRSGEEEGEGDVDVMRRRRRMRAWFGGLWFVVGSWRLCVCSGRAADGRRGGFGDYLVQREYRVQTGLGKRRERGCFDAIYGRYLYVPINIGTCGWIAAKCGYFK